MPLILEPAQARAVARRAKTQLRRSTSSVRLADGSLAPRPCGLRASNTYEVLEGEAGGVLARVVVREVHLQALGDVDDQAAAAEGHGSLAGFADWWLRRHDRGWPPQEEKLCSNCHGHAEFTDHDGELVPCTLCEIGVVMGDAPTSDEQVLERFTRHAGRHVWVVSFMLDDRVFLHRHSQRGYTSNPAEAMTGEPEVIGEPLPLWKTRAERRHRADVTADSTRLSGLPSIDDQLEQLRRLAAERGVDLTRERHVVEQRRERAARKLDEAA